MLSRFILITTFIILLTLPALAAEDPCAYVSTASGHQILCADRGTGVVSVTYTGNADFNPRDLATGPDGKLYIANPTDRTILRINPKQPNPKTLEYVAQLPANAGSPESLSFSGS